MKIAKLRSTELQTNSTIKEIDKQKCKDIPWAVVKKKRIFRKKLQRTEHGQTGSKVLSVLEKADCKINPDIIENCHQLSKKSDNVIINFSRRKECQHVRRVKKDLRNLNLEDLGFHGENYIYINRSLCQYYWMLWSKSKKLHSMGRIHSVYIAGESIKITVHENSTPLAIKHVNDFEYHFPDVELSRTSTSNSGS